MASRHFRDYGARVSGSSVDPAGKSNHTSPDSLEDVFSENSLENNGPGSPSAGLRNNPINSVTSLMSSPTGAKSRGLSLRTKKPMSQKNIINLDPKLLNSYENHKQYSKIDLKF